MRIRVESRGGFVGRMVGERDLDELSPEQRSALEKLRASPPPASAPGPAPRYKITVTDEHGTHELEVPEEDMPQALTSIPRFEL